MNKKILFYIGIIWTGLTSFFVFLRLFDSEIWKSGIIFGILVAFLAWLIISLPGLICIILYNKILRKKDEMEPAKKEKIHSQNTHNLINKINSSFKNLIKKHKENVFNTKKRHDERITLKKIDSLQKHVNLKEISMREKDNLFLKKDEKIIFQDVCELYEERAIGAYQSVGLSVRVAKGWWVRTGGGRSESHGELRNIDDGALFITTDRFIFKGNLRHNTYYKKDIVSVEPLSDSIRVAIDGRQKTLSFKVFNILLASAAFKILQNGVLEKEAKDYIKNELKNQIAAKLALIGGDLSIVFDNISLTRKKYEVLVKAVNSDIGEYSVIIEQIPKDILNFQLKLKDMLKLIRSLDEEYQSINEKFKTDYDIKNQFDIFINKENNKITNSLKQLVNAFEDLEIGSIENK